MRRRWLSLALILLAALAGAALARGREQPATASVERAPGLRGGALPDGLAGAPAPSIALQDARGGRAGTATVAGRPYLVTFLYTRCPDHCPATAASIALALRRLGTRARDVGVLAVSVDPVGDTPERAREFLRRHELPGNVHYLLGRGRELRAVWARWLVGGRDGGAPVTHSLATWVVDARGRLRAVYAGDVPGSADLAHDLRALL